LRAKPSNHIGAIDRCDNQPAMGRPAPPARAKRPVEMAIQPAHTTTRRRVPGCYKAALAWPKPARLMAIDGTPPGHEISSSEVEILSYLNRMERWQSG